MQCDSASLDLSCSSCPHVDTGARYRREAAKVQQEKGAHHRGTDSVEAGLSKAPSADHPYLQVPAEHSEPAKKKAKGAVKLEAEVKAEQTPKEGTAKVAKSRTAAIAKAVPEVLVAKPVKKSEGRRSKSKASEDGEAAASSATAQNSGQGRGTRRSVRNIAIT